LFDSSNIAYEGGECPEYFKVEEFAGFRMRVIEFEDFGFIFYRDCYDASKFLR
jgi:hypothetical protein